MAKARIFVDFWNFQLSFNDRVPSGVRADWTKIVPWLVTRSAALGLDLTFEEMTVYLSHDPRKAEDKRLRDWAINFLDRQPGVKVKMLERKPKGSPLCPACHKKITLCPHCGGSTTGTIEKGVDTAIVTDLLSLAWEGAWEVAILVSSDRDFIPAVDMLGRKGFRVINAHFSPVGVDLARACWAAINFNEDLSQIYLQTPSTK